MKRNVFTALTLAVLLFALTLVFASCSNGGGTPARTDGPDATVTAAPEEDPTAEISDEVAAALEDYYALKQGDFSQLGKYWYGTVSRKITAEGAEMESAIYGRRLYHYAAPIIMTAERWDEMWAEANGKFADDPMLEFVRAKLEGLYAEYDLSKAVSERAKDGMTNTFADRYSIDITKAGPLYVLDASVSPSRLEELGGYFDEYFGYTLEDVRDAAREAGMTNADEIGTVDRYFVFEYSDFGEIVSSVEYSEEALERLEALCKASSDDAGEPLCYGRYEYTVTDAKAVSDGEDFKMLRDEYKESTGDDLLEIVRVTLKEKKIGQTAAATGEYRELAAEDQTETVFDEIFLKTSRGWEPERIDFPWGDSARRVLLLYVEVFDN
ncbi:MAG: hypothetical protein IKH09_05110 [Clostridia bacterium]|nr:hypothetical protein [Clostridia bacterium]